jgi:TRAP-type C4-dicarboxylate transport system permease small subunit
MKKKYWVILVLIFLVWLVWYIRAPDAASRQLTRAIETQASEKLKNYPYKFRVLKFSQGTAYVSTPRSFAVPAFKALAVLYPDINTRNPNDPAFIAVEQLLGEVQSEAAAIVKAQPGVKEVRWEIDRDWLNAHHIDIP